MPRQSLSYYPLVIVFTVLIPIPGHAWDAFTGFEIDDRGQYFGYGGTRFTTSPTGNTFEPFAELFVLRQQYFFKSEGEILRSQVTQGIASIGLRKTIGKLEMAGSTGVALREKQEETVLPTGGKGKDTVQKIGYRLGGEASYWTDNDGFEGLATYTNLDHLFFGRARWKHVWLELNEGSSINPGLEFVALGNSEFKQILVGGLLESDLGTVVLLIKGGYQNNSTFHGGGYGGIEVSLSF
jgi:hypothetical protein